MKPLALRLILAVTASALLSTAPAVAAAPWRPVTPPSDNLTQVALARTGDGILHAVWPNVDKTELDATTIAPGLTVGTSTPIVSGWSSLGNAALLASADGLRVFWSGDHTGADDDPQHGIDTAAALPNGSPWTVAPARIDPGGPAFTSDVSAAPVSHGAIESYSGTVGVFVHAGLDSTVAPGEFQSALGGCCGQDSSVATDEAGDGVVAWASNATGASGVVVQHVDLASGTPTGSPTILDKSAKGDDFVPTGSRVALTTRPGAPGFLIAYPTGFPTPDVVRLWRVGGGDQVISTDAAPKTQVAISTAPDGRVWVVWGEDSGGDVVVRARRSNRAASIFGATVTLPAPAGTGTLYHLAADPEPSGALDALGHFASATDRAPGRSRRSSIPG